MGIASIPTYATGDTIEASWANTLRDNGLVLDARTGGDPGAAGKIPISSSALGSLWTALTGLTDAITTTKAVTALGFQAGASGVHGGTGGVNGGSAGFTTTGPYEGGTIASGAAFLVKGIVVGADGLAIGYQIASSLSDGTTPPIAIHASQATVICTNLKAADSDKLDGKSAGNSSGNIPVSNGTVCTNLNAAQVAGKAPTATPGAAALPLADGSGKLDGWITTSDFAKLSTGGNFTTAPTINSDAIAVVASGTYTGNGGVTRQITTGFACRYVLLTAYNSSGSGTFIRFDLVSTTAAENPALTGNYGTGGVVANGAALSAATATKLHATDGFVVDANDFSNTNPLTYRYVAFG